MTIYILECVDEQGQFGVWGVYSSEEKLMATAKKIHLFHNFSCYWCNECELNSSIGTSKSFTLNSEGNPALME